MKGSPRFVVLVLGISLLAAPVLSAAPRSEPAELTGSGWWSSWTESVVGWLGTLAPIFGSEGLPPANTQSSDDEDSSDTGPGIDPWG